MWRMWMSSDSRTRTAGARPLTPASRAIRGVLLLEQIATPEARELLQWLASGATGSMLTLEAQAARERVRNDNP